MIYNPPYVEPWQAFPYNGASDWQDFGGAETPLQYRRYTDEVEIRGTMKKATAGAVGDLIGTLPADHAPAVGTIRDVTFRATNTFAAFGLQANGQLVARWAATAGQDVEVNARIPIT